MRLCETGGEFFRALIERIDAAREQVMLETYIFCDDAAGRPVSDALIRAAQRGVRVRVITDGIGTARLPLFDTGGSRRRALHLQPLPVRPLRLRARIASSR